ncbi:MAG: FKBP-type peptidyl-prolyl cis-trans isomerase [Kosmotogaceae bacterium]|nr:FKBP-type peptidyl-prolyl cis-trans isomerase [Kosmotogaceae bacterium]
MIDEEKPEVVEEKEDQEEAEDENVEEEIVSTVEEAPEEEIVSEEEKEIPESEEEEPEEEKEEHFEDAVNKGDFIKVEMTGTSVETGEVFETTDEELAREEGIYDESRTYGPRLVVVGEGFVLRGLDERLPGTPFNEEVEIEIPPEEAFGERNLADVQMIAYRILRSKGINPYVGAEIEIDGRPAIIRSVGAGRVQVDYNHPLAGRQILYKIKVVEHLTDEKDRMKALIGRRFLGIDTDEFNIRKTKKKIRIGIPDQIFFGENIQIAKRGVALDILRYFEDIDEVEYYETIKRS